MTLPYVSDPSAWVTSTTFALGSLIVRACGGRACADEREGTAVADEEADEDDEEEDEEEAAGEADVLTALTSMWSAGCC